MKILYIHQYFKTPKQYGATRSYWISQSLIAKGHKVTMLCSDPLGEIQKGIERVHVDGIDVIYIKVPYDQKMSVFRRLLAFIIFMFRSARVAFQEKNIDLVFASSVPLTIGFPALLLKKFKKIPYFFEVRNLWPEVPIQMGALNNKLVKKIAIWFEKTIYKNALHIIALSPGIVEGVMKRNIPPSKISMIPNMSKIDNFGNRPPDFKIGDKYGLKKDSFKVIYFGAMGIANGLNYIIKAIELLENDQNIEFILIGRGALKTSLEEKCNSMGLKNVYVLEGLPMKELSEIVNICDVSLVTYSNIPVFETHSPNKLFDSFSAGKPVITNTPGWIKGLVTDNNCGLFANPEKSEDLVKQILFLKENPEKCILMGKNSRKLAETKFDKSILCEEIVNTIESISK